MHGPSCISVQVSGASQSRRFGGSALNQGQPLGLLHPVMPLSLRLAPCSLRLVSYRCSSPTKTCGGHMRGKIILEGELDELGKILTYVQDRYPNGITGVVEPEPWEGWNLKIA